MFIGHGISGKPLFTLPMSRHFELLYNTGVQLLHCSKPLPAFDCLIEAVKVYSSNPRLWLRLAECCIMANKKVTSGLINTSAKSSSTTPTLLDKIQYEEYCICIYCILNLRRRTCLYISLSYMHVIFSLSCFLANA